MDLLPTNDTQKDAVGGGDKTTLRLAPRIKAQGIALAKGRSITLTNFVEKLIEAEAERAALSVTTSQESLPRAAYPAGNPTLLAGLPPAATAEIVHAVFALREAMPTVIAYLVSNNAGLKEIFYRQAHSPEDLEKMRETVNAEAGRTTDQLNDEFTQFATQRLEQLGLRVLPDAPAEDPSRSTEGAR